MCWACKHRNLQLFLAAADMMSECYVLESIHMKTLSRILGVPKETGAIRLQISRAHWEYSHLVWHYYRADPDFTSIISCAGESDVRSNHWAGETTQQIKYFAMQVWALELRTPEPTYKKHDAAVHLESQGTGSRAKDSPKEVNWLDHPKQQATGSATDLPWCIRWRGIEKDIWYYS